VAEVTRQHPPTYTECAADPTTTFYCAPCSEAIGEWVNWTPGHLADALLPLLERREAEAWPCANYRRPVTCLTAPSSEPGRCDFCAEQAKEPAMKALWMASKEAAERGDIGTADGPAVWEWLMDRADRIGDA
jgi:hypothetical protein